MPGRPGWRHGSSPRRLGRQSPTSRSRGATDDQRHLDDRPDQALQGCPGPHGPDPRRARPGPSSAFSARTAPARRPPSRSWPAWPTRRPAARPINGVPVSAAGEHRRQLGYLAQDPRFYGWMTGRETLRHVRASAAPTPTASARIASLLERVGIADAADRRTSTYSGRHAPASRASPRRWSADRPSSSSTSPSPRSTRSAARTSST